MGTRLQKNPFNPCLPLSPALEVAGVAGPKGCGKTRMLAEQAADLLKSGAHARDVLIVAATPTAAEGLRALVADILGQDAGLAQGLEPTTARRIALSVLDCPDALRATGRRARLATEAERRILFEDMKTSGVRPRRLREMLKFLHRGWSELADEDPSWLIDQEERDVQERYRDYLAFYEILVEPETSNMALKYLRISPEALDAARVGHVLADDYQLMSRTSQLMLNAIAQQSLFVTADPANTAAVFDSYPYAFGLEDLTALHPSAAITQLSGCRRSGRTALAVARILSDKEFDGQGASAGAASPAAALGLAPGSRCFAEIAADSPRQELEAVADWVARQIAQGTPPERICVTHPDAPAWAGSAEKALAARGIGAVLPQRPQCVRGDVRGRASSQAARMASLLMLATDESDSMAWRCWLGCGDWLTRSAAVDALRGYASPNSLSLARLLGMTARDGLSLSAIGERAGGGPQEGQDWPSSRRAATNGLTEIQGLFDRGLLLLANLKAAGPGGIASVLGEEFEDAPSILSRLFGQWEDETASQLGRRLLDSLTFPAIRPLPGKVCIAPWSLLCGTRFDCVVAIGMVNGFAPDADCFDLTSITPDQQARRQSEWIRRLYALAGAPEKQLAISRFNRIDLDSAQRLHLKIDRIGLVHGARVATVGRSELLGLLDPR